MAGVASVGRRTRARTIGRAVGIGVFAVLVGGSTLAWTVQIMVQVWSPPTSKARGSCRPALVGLIHAVDRARQSATSGSVAETVLLAKFRDALRPEWDGRPSITALCAKDPVALRALAEVDRYRYAEEHGVRYLAADLARRRENVRKIERSLAVAESGRTEDTRPISPD